MADTAVHLHACTRDLASASHRSCKAESIMCMRSVLRVLNVAMHHMMRRWWPPRLWG